MRGLSTRLMLSCVLMMMLVGVGHAADWPFFRGPEFRGVTTGKWNPAWPVEGPKVAWKANVGTGASSFTVQGDRALTMGNQSDHDVVTCFKLDTGEVLWTFKYPSRFDKRMYEGGTSTTPTIDGDRVYTLSHLGDLHCLKLSDGSLIWKKHLIKDFGGRYPQWKYGGSPLVIGNLLVLDTGSKTGSTLALDKATGEPVWANADDTIGYGTPIPYSHGGRDGILIIKARHLVSHDRKTGKEMWRIPWKTSFDVNVSSPSVVGDLLVHSSGYKDGRTIAFRLGDGEPTRLWEQEDLKTKTSSVVVVNDHVFGISSDGPRKGHLICVKVSDGSIAWSQPGFGEGTLISDGTRLIVLSERGTLMVVEASGDGYKEINRAQVLGKRCWVHPVLAHGYLLVRNNEGQAVCLDVRE